ncbi:aminotransferase class I/II-fold pyridoxal phosphate-dependent enzyme, partial [Nocardia nova]
MNEDPLSWLDERAGDRVRAGLRRQLRARPAHSDLIDLASNDYLGLSRHPEVIAGAVEAVRTWGAGATGSRLVTGTTVAHEEFEA